MHAGKARRQHELDTSAREAGGRFPGAVAEGEAEADHGDAGTGSGEDAEQRHAAASASTSSLTREQHGCTGEAAVFALSAGTMY